MPLEYVQPLILLFLGGLAVAGYELRASLDPPTCKQCVHCRLIAAQKRQEEERIAQWRTGRSFTADDRDKDDGAKKR